MTTTFTNKAKYLFITGAINPSSDLRIGLLKTLSSHVNVPNIDFVSDMEAHADFAELTGVAGYLRTALTGINAFEDDTSNARASLDANNVNYGALNVGGTVVGAFIYRYNVSDAAAEVIVIYDLPPTPTNGAVFTVPITNFAHIV